jgi:hypothetical protein
MAIVPWLTVMHKITLPHYWTEHVNGVTVFRILIKEVRDADSAVAVFRGVTAMARRMLPAFILIDLSQTKHMSGMAFVVLSSWLSKSPPRGAGSRSAASTPPSASGPRSWASARAWTSTTTRRSRSPRSDGVRPHHPEPPGSRGRP